MLFYQPELVNGISWLSEEESRHCVKVLRKREGEIISVTDGKGFFYDCLITKATPLKCELQIQNIIAEAKRNFRIHLAIAPTKSPDRMEWLVEKITEIGVAEISFVSCDHSERSFFKIDRLKKVAVSAIKQSKRASLPIINNLVPYSEIIKRSEADKYIAFVDFNNPHHLLKIAKKEKNYLVLIGPEGDFSASELNSALEAGFTKVSLGSNTLRTETAGMVACCLLNSLNI